MSIFTNPYLASIFTSDTGEKFTLLEVIKQLTDVVGASVDSRLDDIETDIGTIESDINDLNGRLTTIGQTISRLSGDLDEDERLLAGLQQDLADLDVTDLTRRVRECETDLGNCETDINGLGTSLDTLNGEVV